MNIVNVSENIIDTKYILITQESDINEYITNNVFITDDLNRGVNVVEVSRGIQGFQGPAGKDGVIFDILPIISGGTNNTSFTNNKIIYYDGNKLASSSYSLSDIITGGVLAGTGTIVISSGGVVTVHSNLGSGLSVNANNQIVVDFNAIDQRILQQITITAGSGLVYTSGFYHIGKSADIKVNADSIELTPTGVAGTYSKITTDSKGRVINGQNISSTDITNTLGYTPWHAGNDGPGSELDADKLDGMEGSYLRNINNLTGVINISVLPSALNPGSYTKISVSKYGLVTSGSSFTYSDTTGSLGYRPVSVTGDNINGILYINGSIFSGSIIKLYDNLTTIATNHSSILYNEPRGFRFLYGNSINNPKTGILAYYPGSDTLRITAETSDIIITDRLASTLYGSLTGTNSFSGINNFLNSIYVNQLYVTGIVAKTTGLAINLNSDLLDGKHGAFYLAAENLTGILNANSYKVSITNISGTPNYLTKFDNRTSEPSRTVSNSIIYENENTIFLENGNLFIGTNNSYVTGTTENSLIVGSNNILKNTKSAIAIGDYNIVSGDYSVAANCSGLTKKPYSVTLGKNGITWSENQLAFGIFQEPTGLDSGDGQGQYSTIGLSYYGTAPDYIDLLPKVILPKNKTILYNLDVLMTKLGSSGCAAFKFESGVVRNVTRRNPDNLAVEENVTIEVKTPIKKNIYNDSYLRDYILSLQLSENFGYDTTKIKIDKSPLSEPEFLDIQNLNSNIITSYNPTSIDGTYINDQAYDVIIANLDKPKTTGYYYQPQDDYKITIYSYDHKAITGTELYINFLDVNLVQNNENYIVTDIIDDNTLKVSPVLDSGEIYAIANNQAYLVVNTSNPYKYDNSNCVYIKYINNDYKVSEINCSLNYDGLTSDKYYFSNLSPVNLSSGDRVLTAQASYNEGQCTIIPKRNFTGLYQQYSNFDRYTAVKAKYIQYPSVSGQSTVVISGINKDNSENYYYSWNNSIVSGSIQNTGNAYFEFIKFIDTTYFTTGNFKGSGVTGIVVNTSYGDIRGFYNVAPVSDYTFKGEVSGFIESLNGSSVNQGVKSSGGHIDFSSVYGDFIFFPYNTGNIPPVGTIRISESGAYRNARYAKNGFYNILNYNSGTNSFTTIIKYNTPYTGYAVTGFMDLYLPIPKIANIEISNVNPEFNRNKNNVRCFLNFSSGINNDNFTIVADNANRSSFSINKEYYYPNFPSGITGVVQINTDRDHGLLESSQEIWRYSPLIVTSGSVNSSSPYKGIYTVVGVSGDIVLFDEKQYHLRNENNAKFRFGMAQSSGSGVVIDNITGISILNQSYEIEDNDLINIKFFNDNNELGLYKVSGSTNNSFFAFPTGDMISSYFEQTGNIIFSKISTGICYLPQNNIYFNTNISYNNLYNRWTKNNVGNSIEEPVLMKYVASAYNLSCGPEYVCVKLTGTMNDMYENDNLYISFDRPFNALNNNFTIAKVENNNTIITNIRKDSIDQSLIQYLPFSGYAEIIHKHNINNLTNKFPNENNTLYKPSITQISKSGDTNSNLSFMIGHHNQTFDTTTKRQLHALEFNLPATIISGEYRISGELPSIDPYLIKMKPYDAGNDNGSDTAFNLLINSIKPINIDSIAWKYININDGWNYTTGINDYINVSNGIINIFNNVDWNLRIKTKYGTYSTGLKPIAPTVDIFGIKNYSITNLEFNKYDSNYLDGYWTIDVSCSGFNFSNDKNILVRVQDFSGTDTIPINIKSNPRLNVKNIKNNTIYSNTNSIWYNLINIYGVPSTNFSDIAISVTSGSLASYSWESSISGFSYLISGLSPSTIQNYSPKYEISYSGQSITQSGSNETVSSIPTQLKTYHFDDPIVFTPTCNSYVIPIIIPNTNNDITNLSVSIGGLTATSISVGYNTSLKRYLAQIYLNSNTPFGLYPTSFTFTYNSTSTVINRDVIFADTLRINKSNLFETIDYDINTPWTLDFSVVGGDGTNNTKYPAKVNIFNTPIIGYYALNDQDNYALQTYKINDIFQSGTQDHKISLTGIKTIYDNNFWRNTGLYNIHIYAEDSQSYCSDIISVNIFENPYLINLSDIVYSHFNKSASFPVDSKYANNLSVIKNDSNSEIPGAINAVKRYDFTRDLYNNYITTSIVSGIWDAQISYQTDNSETDNFYSTTKFTPKCKGILNDKIYVTAKLTALEVSNSYIKTPIKISNLQNPIGVGGGQPWKISFNTCYGLADLNYPPTIYLSGTPTTCSGVSSSVPDEQIPNGCITKREFNTQTKCWYFEFNGQPLCNASPLYNVFIQAIDTVDGVITVGSDSANTTLSYGELPVHKPPELSKTDLTANSSSLLPKCAPVSIEWSGSIQNRDVCPVFTGIKQISFIGNGMPSGLLLTINDIYFKDGTRYDPQTINYSFAQGYGINSYGGSGFYQIYNFSGYESNISGVRGYINGNPTEFFETSYSITGTIIDGRDNDGGTILSFTDSSEPTKFPLQYATVYFANSDYIELTNSDALSLASMDILNPPAHIESFIYSGILSQRNGPHSGLYYRSDSLNQIITITGLNRSLDSNIAAGSKAYIKFDNQLSSNTKVYTVVQKLSSDAFTIYSPTITTSFNNRTGCYIVFPTLSTDAFGNFGGTPTVNIDENFNGTLLGAGYYNDSNHTLIGFVRPSYKSYLDATTIKYDESISINFNTYNSGLYIEPLDGVCCNHGKNSILYKNCYETGIARISGIIIPKPSLEVTDPIPSPLEYAYDNQAYGLSVRLAYGVNENQKNDLANRRNMSFKNNKVSGLFYTIDQKETLITANEASQVNDELGNLNFSYSNYSGQILHLKVLRQSDKFPTIDQFRIPYIDNDYYWIFANVSKNNDDTYSINNYRTSFPPYVPIKISQHINFVSGTSINLSGNIIGGFTPNSKNIYGDGADQDKNYLVQGTGWSYSQYKPICTGIISQPLFRTYSGICIANPNDPTTINTPSVIQLFNINSTGIYTANDILLLEQVGDPSWNFPLKTGIAIINTGNYPLSGPAVSGSLIGLTSPQYNSTSGYFNITKGVSYKIMVNNDYRLYPKYNLLASGDKINILPLIDNIEYSQILLSATGNMSIISGDSTYWYARASKHTDLTSYGTTGFAYIYKTINNSQINLSLSYNKIGLWNANISGSTNNLDLDYKYQILTIDNTGLPLLTGLGWEPYKFGKTYDLHIDKPFEIYGSTTSSTELTQITGYTNYGSPNWISTFYIKNGIRPLIDNPPMIEIDNNKYGFIYSLSYNDIYDMYKVSMTGFTQSIQCVKISNNFSYKELNLTFVET